MSHRRESRGGTKRARPSSVHHATRVCSALLHRDPKAVQLLCAALYSGGCTDYGRRAAYSLRV